MPQNATVDFPLEDYLEIANFHGVVKFPQNTHREYEYIRATALQTTEIRFTVVGKYASESLLRQYSN